MTNTFEENFFKQFIKEAEEEREIFSLLTDCIAQMGKDKFKAMLIKARMLSREKIDIVEFQDAMSGD